MAMTLERARQEGREFFRPAEVAQIGGLSPTFIYQLIASGKLPSIRIGGTIRIPFVEVEKLFATTPSKDHKEDHLNDDAIND